MPKLKDEIVALINANSAPYVKNFHYSGRFITDDDIERIAATISASKENEGKQAGGWVKATIRKPEKGIYHVKVSNKKNTVVMFGVGLVTIGEFSVIRFLNGATLQEENNGFDDENIEWLDESVTIDSIRVKEAGERMKLVGEVERLKGLLRKEVEQTGGSWITYSKINNL